MGPSNAHSRENATNIFFLRLSDFAHKACAITFILSIITFIFSKKCSLTHTSNKLLLVLFYLYHKCHLSFKLLFFSFNDM